MCSLASQESQNSCPAPSEASSLQSTIKRFIRKWVERKQVPVDSNGTTVPLVQCSRWKLSYEFHFEGLSNFSSSVEGRAQIQDVNLKIKKWNTKLILNLCMNHMVHVSNTMWRIKNQLSNSTSCSDNALQVLWEYYIEDFMWCLHFQFGVAFWRVVLKGQITFEGHWRLQSWTQWLLLPKEWRWHHSLEHPVSYVVVVQLVFLVLHLPLIIFMFKKIMLH